MNLTPEQVEQEREKFNSWWETEGKFRSRPKENCFRSWQAALSQPKADQPAATNEDELGNEIADKAMDYLQRKGLQGSPLREDAAPLPECTAQKNQEIVHVAGGKPEAATSAEVK